MQHRPVAIVAHIAQHRQQMVEIVPVDRADVVEAELLEHGAAGDIAARVLDARG
jgi:DNA-binding TFAR19-related protein (PDSD5 family)